MPKTSGVFVLARCSIRWRSVGVASSRFVGSWTARWRRSVWLRPMRGPNQLRTWRLEAFEILEKLDKSVSDAVRFAYACLLTRACVDGVLETDCGDLYPAPSLWLRYLAVPKLGILCIPSAIARQPDPAATGSLWTIGRCCASVVSAWSVSD